MNDLELFKSEAIKAVAESGDYRILTVDGKAVLAEKFSSQPATMPSHDKTFLLGAITLIFVAGVIAGIHYQSSQSAQTIKSLQAENLILESKLSKIRELVNP